MEMQISLKIANTKGKILSTVNMASVEYNLPAFILEGILSDVMLEISLQAKIEMLNDINRITENKEENSKEE